MLEVIEQGLAAATPDGGEGRRRWPPRTATLTHTCIYIYIYIYIERETERAYNQLYLFVAANRSTYTLVISQRVGVDLTVHEPLLNILAIFYPPLK